jgi:hypothetical protein
MLSNTSVASIDGPPLETLARAVVGRREPVAARE